MANNFYKLISILFHPILMTFATIKLTIFIMPVIKLTLEPFMHFINSLIVLTSIVFPLLIILFFLLTKRIKSIEMQYHKDRSIPLLLCALSLSLGTFLVGQILLYAPIIKAELLCAIILLVFASIITKYWKISLHMIGIGGLVGAITGIHLCYGGLTQVIVPLILTAGIIGVARVMLKAHNNIQIYAGFSLAFLVELVGVLIVLK